MKNFKLLERDLLEKVILCFTVGTSLYHLYKAGFGIELPILHRAIHVSLLLSLAFFIFPFSKKYQKTVSRTLFYNIFPAIVVLIIGLYLFFNYERLETRWPMVDIFTTADQILGVLLIILILEATRRALGLPLIIIVVLGIFYVFLGPDIPGRFSHKGYKFVEFIDYQFLSKEGIFGMAVGVSSTYIFLFVLFGSFLLKTGAGDFFLDISKALTGGTRGGPAKIAVVSSGLFGMMSGSPVSDVIATGTFTIPMMKKTGYSRVFAGAVEAVASSGGAIMPPVMGSAVFLMVEMTGIPYSQVIKAAIFPAILYYLALAWVVHLEAIKIGLKSLPKEEVPKIGETLKQGWFFMVPVILLVGLIIYGYTPILAAFYCILTTVIVSWFKKERRMGLKNILGALDNGARQAIMVSVTCAAIDILIGSIFLTGIGGKFSSMVILTAGKSWIIPLFFIMIATMILGMGVPLAAAYLLAAFLGAPALIELGVPVLSAHLFIIYYAVASAITPPVCVAAYAAGSIADENPMKIGFMAMRLGVVAFVVPYMFVYEPSLLFIGSIGEVVQAVSTAIIGILFLTAGLEGWLLKKMGWFQRCLSIGGGLTLVFPGLITDLIGFTLCGIVLLSQWIIKRK